jgi:hypothetical protein
MKKLHVEKPRFEIEELEERIAPTITKITTYLNHPGPTDTQVNTATNPAGNQVPGQSSTSEVPNRLAK